MDLDEILSVILLHSVLQLVTCAYHCYHYYTLACILAYYTPVCGFVKPSKVILHTHKPSCLKCHLIHNHLESPQATSALPNFVGKYFIPSSTICSSSPQGCQFRQSISWLWLMAYTTDASSSVCYACSLDIVLLWKQKLDKSLRTSLTAADQHVLVYTYS